MKYAMYLKFLAGTAAVFGLAGSALAQASPAGLWRTIDDNTGKPRGEVRIVETAKGLSGRLVRSLAADPSKEPTTCKVCTDDRKDQPMEGLEIVRGGKLAADGQWYEGGELMDPDNGKTYKLKMRVAEGGAKLTIRGYIGPFYRTQTWERTQ
jgi:uncharacterized protein (DUF2147 family)